MPRPESPGAESAEAVVENVEGLVAPESQEAAPQQGTSGDQPADLGLNFRLEDVPEEYRPHVEQYTRQVQGALTRKTQALAEQRRELEGTLELRANLQDETKRDATLRQLLIENGWEVGDDDTDDDDDVDVQGDDDGQEVRATTDPELVERLATLEAREEARLEQQFNNEVNARVESALEAYRAEEGLDVVPDAVKAGIAAQLGGLDLVDGYPDINGAITLYKEQQAIAMQAYMKSKRAPAMDLSGVSAAPAFDPRNATERRARAAAIAGRHL